MFLRNNAYEHTLLGNFRYKNGIWTCEGNRITYYLDGSKLGPSQAALNQSHSLENISELIEQSLTFLLESDIQEVDDQLNNIQAESVWFHGEQERVSVSFGHLIESWEYTVHFRNQVPIEVSLTH